MLGKVYGNNVPKVNFKVRGALFSLTGSIQQTLFSTEVTNFKPDIFSKQLKLLLIVHCITELHLIVKNLLNTGFCGLHPNGIQCSGSQHWH